MPGDLWFKNSRYADHVYRYDGQTLHSLQMPKVKVGEDFIANHRGTPSPYGVYTIYRDKLDHVWFGTAAVGVCRFDGKSFQWLTSDDVNELHDGPSNGVRSIIEDHNGHFWFNTRYRYAINQSPFALSPVTPSEGIFQRHPGMGSLDGKPDGEYEYMSIAKDRNNLLWIATYQGGVYCYDGTQLKHYPIMDGSKIVMLSLQFTLTMKAPSGSARIRVERIDSTERHSRDFPPARMNQVDDPTMSQSIGLFHRCVNLVQQIVAFNRSERSIRFSSRQLVQYCIASDPSQPVAKSSRRVMRFPTTNLASDGQENALRQSLGISACCRPRRIARTGACCWQACRVLCIAASWKFDKRS